MLPSITPRKPRVSNGTCLAPCVGARKSALTLFLGQRTVPEMASSGYSNDTWHIWSGWFVATGLVAAVRSIQSNVGDQQHVCVFDQYRFVWQHGIDDIVDKFRFRFRFGHVNICNGVRYGHSQPVSAIDHRVAIPFAGAAILCLDQWYDPDGRDITHGRAGGGNRSPAFWFSFSTASCRCSGIKLAGWRSSPSS